MKPKLHTVIIAGKQLVCDSRGRVIGSVLALPTVDGTIVKPAVVQLKVPLVKIQKRKDKDGHKN